MSEKIRFDRVGFYDADGKEQSSWLALIDTVEKLETYLKTQAIQNAFLWFDIRSSNMDLMGHCRSQKASQFKTLLGMEVEKGNRSLAGQVGFIAKVTTSTKVKIFSMYGSVYIGENGGCRDTKLRDDGRLDEHIFESCCNKDYVFPTVSEIDVDILRWQGGNHFYITVNGITQSIDGKEKYKTIGDAEDAKDLFLRENRFVRKRENYPIY